MKDNSLLEKEQRAKVTGGFYVPVTDPDTKATLTLLERIVKAIKDVGTTF